MCSQRSALILNQRNRETQFDPIPVIHGCVVDSGLQREGREWQFKLGTAGILGPELPARPQTQPNSSVTSCPIRIFRFTASAVGIIVLPQRQLNY
jgi:hypothetical protein